jgi:hypothetical protein
VKCGLHISSKKHYIYLNEIVYAKKLIAVVFNGAMEILAVDFSENHMSRPANIKMKFIPLNYDVEITFDSSFVNSIITNKANKEESIALHRYLINEGRYSETLLMLNEGTNNCHVIDILVKELKRLLYDENLYFYYWDGDKRYKKQGAKVTRLKPGEF